MTTEGKQRLTTGERIKAQKMANDYMLQALEMKQKADGLMKEAAQKTGLVEQIDQARQNYTPTVKQWQKRHCTEYYFILGYFIFFGKLKLLKEPL